MHAETGDEAPRVPVPNDKGAPEEDGDVDGADREISPVECDKGTERQELN